MFCFSGVSFITKQIGQFRYIRIPTDLRGLGKLKQNQLTIQVYTTVVRPALESTLPQCGRIYQISYPQDRVHSEKGHAHYFSINELQ